MSPIASLAALLLVPTAPTAEKTTTSVVAMPLTSDRVSAQTLNVLGPLCVDAVDLIGPHKVISPDNISAILGQQKMQDALGAGKQPPLILPAGSKSKSRPSSLKKPRSSMDSGVYPIQYREDQASPIVH